MTGVGQTILLYIPFFFSLDGRHSILLVFIRIYQPLARGIVPYT